MYNNINIISMTNNKKITGGVNEISSFTNSTKFPNKHGIKNRRLIINPINPVCFFK